MITLTNIQKSFSTRDGEMAIGLKPFCLKIEAGEQVSFIGPSGAGKSTLLGLISGDLIADRGTVFLNGRNYTFKGAYQRSGLIAQMGQDPRLGTAGDLTIEENLALASKRGQKRGFSWAVKRNTRQNLIETLKQLEMGLEKRLNAVANTLSGGQRQALSLAMTTLSPAKILLLDEPTAALDPDSAERLLNLIKKITEEKNLTVLQVTHNLDQAKRYSTRLITVKNGEVSG